MRNPEVTVCPEVVILGDLDHPHIVQLLDLCEDDEFLYIIMELMRYGTLTDAMIRIVQEDIKFECEDGIDVIRQIVLALSYMHNKCITHRDLKLDNILVEWEETKAKEKKIICKVADFGMAITIDPHKVQKSHPGTVYYMAPELVTKQERYDCKVDVWALGVMTYQIFSGGVFPFEGEEFLQSAESLRSKKEKREAIFKDITTKKPNLEIFNHLDHSQLLKDFLT